MLNKIILSIFSFFIILSSAYGEFINSQNDIDHFVNQNQNIKTLYLDLRSSVDLTPLTELENLEELTISLTNFYPNDLSPLSYLKKIRSLHIVLSGLGSVDLEQISDLSSLQTFGLHSDYALSSDPTELRKSLFTIPKGWILEKLDLNRSMFFSWVNMWGEKEPFIDNWILLLDRLPTLKVINLSNLTTVIDLEITTEIIKSIAEKIPELESLIIANGFVRNPFDASLFKELAKLKKLKTLDLSINDYDYCPYYLYYDEDLLLFLPELHDLETLNLSGIKNMYGTSNLSLENLKNLTPNLKNLILNNTKCHAFYLDLTQLERLSMQNSYFTSEVLEQLTWVTYPSLTHLDFYGVNCRKVPFSQLAPNLEELNLAKSNITGGDVKELIHLKKLQKLNLTETKITQSALKHLSKIESLEELNLSHCPIKDGSFSLLTNVKNLNLSHCPLLVSDLEELSKLQQLETLILKALPNKNITESRIENLILSLPNTKIITQ